MLKRFEVQGYKNFKEKLVMDFSDIRDYQFNPQCIRNNLLNNAIIYGKNGVGKTNLGSAILDIKRSFVRNIRQEENFLNADSNTDYAQFKYIFQFEEDEIQYEYKKKNINLFLEEKFVLNGEVIFFYNHSTKKKEIYHLEKIGAEFLNWELLDDGISVLNYLINTIPLSSSPLLEKMYDFISGMILLRGTRNYQDMEEMFEQKIIEEKKVGEIQKILNEFGINEKIEVKTTPTGNKKLYSSHKRPIEFIKNASSGTLSLIDLMVKYQEIKDISFIYIDEFDAFYHFELAEKVIKFLEKIEHCQTITTTHNTSLLSNRIMRPDCFFILTNEKITSIVNSTDRELREGHNLEKLYKSGEFDE